MKIYVASSWRNPYQPAVVAALKDQGHEVYDFRHPAEGDNGFHWEEIDEDWQKWTCNEYINALRHPVAEEGFKKDMDALRACDVCILVQPCGTSSHLELGWAAGAGKRTAVLFPYGFPQAWPPTKDRFTEPELMVKMADRILLGHAELDLWLSSLKFYHQHSHGAYADAAAVRESIESLKELSRWLDAVQTQVEEETQASIKRGLEGPTKPFDPSSLKNLEGNTKPIEMPERPIPDITPFTSMGHEILGVSEDGTIWAASDGDYGSGKFEWYMVEFDDPAIELKSLERWREIRRRKVRHGED